MSLFLEGGKRAVILMHGYTGSVADVRMQGTFLNQQGYSVYMPLFTGHGMQDIRQVLQATTQQWRKDADHAVKHLLNKGFEQIAVFGLSMGGLFAVDLLTQQKTHLIGGGSFNSPIPMTTKVKLEQTFKQIADKLYHEALGDRVSYMQQIAEQLPSQLTDIEQFSEQVAERLMRVECPVYIAQSGKDDMIEIETGLRMKERLPFAEVDYHYFAEAPHVITVSKERQVFNQTLLEFIQQLDWRD